MGFFSKEEPETVEVFEKPLRCQICSGGTFYTRQAQLHGAAATLFNLEWTGTTCTCIICSQCGYVHWFFPAG